MSLHAIINDKYNLTVTQKTMSTLIENIQKLFYEDLPSHSLFRVTLIRALFRNISFAQASKMVNFSRRIYHRAMEAQFVYLEGPM